MNLFPVYTSAIETLSVYLAPVFFALFLVIIIFRKTASKMDAYTQSNRVHFHVGALYSITIVALAIYLHQFNANFFIGMLTGLYIYFSLHYAFIFPLIGICKKSISINMLESILHTERTGFPCSKTSLEDNMALRNAGVDDIRKSRLEQMVLLKFGTVQGNHYKITPLGRKVHELGEFILGIWNQKRL